MFKKHKRTLGFIDPASLIVLGFLAISVFIGVRTVSNTKEGAFDIREEAASPPCTETCVTGLKKTCREVGLLDTKGSCTQGFCCSKIRNTGNDAPDPGSQNNNQNERDEDEREDERTSPSRISDSCISFCVGEGIPEVICRSECALGGNIGSPSEPRPQPKPSPYCLPQRLTSCSYGCTPTTSGGTCNTKSGETQLGNVKPSPSPTPYCDSFLHYDCANGCEPTTEGGKCKDININLAPKPSPSPTPYCLPQRLTSCSYGCTPTTSGGTCKPAPTKSKVDSPAPTPYCDSFLHYDCVNGCEPTTQGGRCKDVNINLSPQSQETITTKTKYCSSIMQIDCTNGCTPTENGGVCKSDPRVEELLQSNQQVAQVSPYCSTQRLTSCAYGCNPTVSGGVCFSPPKSTTQIGGSQNQTSQSTINTTPSEQSAALTPQAPRTYCDPFLITDCTNGCTPTETGGTCKSDPRVSQLLSSAQEPTVQAQTSSPSPTPPSTCFIDCITTSSSTPTECRALCGENSINTPSQIASTPTCQSQGGTCMPQSVCTTSGGTAISASCTSGLICCQGRAQEEELTENGGFCIRDQGCQSGNCQNLICQTADQTVAEQEYNGYTYYSQKDEAWANNPILDDNCNEEELRNFGQTACGPTVTASLISTYGSPIDPYSLAQQEYTKDARCGLTSFEQNRVVLEDHGFDTEEYRGSLYFLGNYMKSDQNPSNDRVAFLSGRFESINGTFGHHSLIVDTTTNRNGETIGITLNDPYFGPNIECAVTGEGSSFECTTETGHTLEITYAGINFVTPPSNHLVETDDKGES